MQAALRAAAAQSSDSKDEEIAALQMEAKSARDKATSIVKHLMVAESEIKSLKALVQKMILNREEAEEVFLKRCWLARYWKLCVQHGDFFISSILRSIQFHQCLLPIILLICDSSNCRKAHSSSIP
ncbi:hypothetical protein AXF42_Ash001404 [Apostasia shenzhenica]|uniref:Uncharacterized protein n=1 Tax=Apostasia shenzhenica TaxID=1088818 RepID=A0A2I0AUT9_9ASPA|nr:hypothetical protein AXF42_Ash001404 [Apostasia shenzhenica]